MFESIKEKIEEIRHSNIQRRKKWMVVTVIFIVVVIGFVWIFVFDIKTVALNNENEKESESISFAEIFNMFSDSIKYAKESFTASMKTISEISNVTEDATSTASTTPLNSVQKDVEETEPQQSVIQLH